MYPKTAPDTPSYDCNYYLKGGVFKADYGSAVTWSQGFDLSADGIGFNAETETGYDAARHSGSPGYPALVRGRVGGFVLVCQGHSGPVAAGRVLRPVVRWRECRL